jgi:shikimate kinase
MTRSEIVLIGPMRAGKSTLAQLLAEVLGIPRVSMDDGEVVGKYFEEAGFEADVARLFERDADPLGYARYIWPFFPHVLERLLAEHRHCVIDLGAGHSVYEEEAAFARVQRALDPYRNIVLVLPSPDMERSAAVLRERTTDVDWLRQVREQHGIDFNEQFLRHPSNHALAKIVVYTEGKTPEETRDEILSHARIR